MDGEFNFDVLKSTLGLENCFMDTRGAGRLFPHSLLFLDKSHGKNNSTRENGLAAKEYVRIQRLWIVALTAARQKAS